MVGEIHCHTYFSLPKWIHRRLPSPFELVDHAVSLGLDFIAITDHDSQAAFSIVNDYALDKGLVVVPAVEVSAKYFKLPYKRAHILAYGVPDTIRSKMSIEYILRSIHSQHGIAVAAHPFGVKYGKATFIGNIVGKFSFDGIEVFNSEESMRSNLQALSLANELGLNQFVGSDAHCLEAVGHSRIELIGSKTRDWKEIVSRMKHGQYRIVSTEFNHEHTASQRLRSSSISFIYHSLRGRAS